MFPPKPLKTKVTAKAFIEAGGILEPGMILTKDYISFFPTVTLVGYDNSYDKWWGNDTTKANMLLQLDHLFIEIDVLDFTATKK